MKNNVYMYLVDNEIKIWIAKENIILNCILSNKILKNGKIIHRPKFIKEIKNYIKKNKIWKRFIKNVLIFILPPNFQEVDKEILKICFEELPFQELKFIKETNLYQLKKNLLWINLNNHYAFLTFLTKQKKETKIWQNENCFTIYEQIDKILELNKNIKKIIFVGNNDLIPQITSKLEKKYDKIILYYENYQEYIITSAIRHNF